MQSLLPPGEPLGADPPSVADPAALAHVLSSIAGCGHRKAGVVFSRSAGCCLRPEFLTAEGAIIDLYFLTAADELAPAEIARAKYVDLTNLLLVLEMVAGDDAARVSAVRAAIGAYALEDTPSPELLAFAFDADVSALARAVLADF